jgi:hypothetical protein
MLGAHSPRDSWARCIDLKSARAGAAPECSLFDGGRKKASVCVVGVCIYRRAHFSLRAPEFIPCHRAALHAKRHSRRARQFITLPEIGSREWRVKNL